VWFVKYDRIESEGSEWIVGKLTLPDYGRVARHSGGTAGSVSKSLDVCARFFQERVARGLGYSLENSLKSFTFSGHVAAIFMVRL
jgi:hypothetical protein